VVISDNFSIVPGANKETTNENNRLTKTNICELIRQSFEGSVREK